MKKAILAAVIAALAAAATYADPVTNQLKVLTVREDGTIPPQFTNTLGTVSDMARLQAATLIAAEKASQAENIYAQTTGELTRVATQLVNNQAIIYRRYFIDSFSSAMIIDDTRDKVWLYDWKEAPAERQTVSGHKGWDCYYAFKGECDIQALKGIFKYNHTLAGGTPREDWEYLDESLVSDPVSLGEKVDPDGVRFNYSYRTTVYLPNNESGFLIISIAPQDADADGSTIVMYGGDRNGLNGVKRIGNLDIEYVGGRAVSITEVE